ncbi:MAG TPA: hypothetical protein VMH02_05840, partial [Verrucomicrobiae bacterium]|nr:hypothetical protein [Verrucomicrobiae bacterium]
GSNQLLGQTLQNLSGYAGALRDWATARTAATASIRLSRRSGDRMQLSFAVQSLAVVAAGIERYDDAARLIGFCDARSGTLHPHRQADQLEDLQYRRLMALLSERLEPEELAALQREGAAFTEDEAVALALAI